MRPVPYAAPTGVAPDATARARNRAGDADLVVPPTVHLHGGPEGEVSAELSAGRIQWVDGLNACTVRNLSARLFSAKPEVGGRLIRLGCLFSPAARAGFLGDTFDGVGLPSGDGRSPAQAKADRGSFEAIVHLANYCAAFRLDVECTRAVVEQALHVAEKGNHHLVKSVLSGVRNDYQKHSVSATHGGKKTTMATYAGYIKRFCAWGVAGERVGTRLVPLSRHTVVLFLEAEAKRRLVRRAAPRRGAGMADEADSDDGDEDAEDEGDGAGVGPSNDAAAVGDGGADDGPPPKRLQRGFGAPASTTPNARTEANRRAAAASLVGRGVTGGTGGGGEPGHVSAEKYGGHPCPRRTRACGPHRWRASPAGSQYRLRPQPRHAGKHPPPRPILQRMELGQEPLDNWANPLCRLGPLDTVAPRRLCL